MIPIIPSTGKSVNLDAIRAMSEQVVAAIVNNANTDGYDFEHLKKDVCGKKGLLQKIKDIFADKKQ